jgi:O-antigen ligase
MENKIAIKQGLANHGEWFVILLVAILLSIGVIGFFWLEMAMIILGIVFIAFVFVRPLTALLIWFILSPVMENYLKIPLGAGIPDITFSRLTIITLFGLILLQTVMRIRTISKLGGIELSMALFALLALMGLSMGDNFKTDVQVLLDGYITPFLLFFLIRNLVSKPEDIRQFLFANVIAGAYLAILGIVQYFTDITLLAPEGFERLMEERASGPFINAEEYGAALSIMSIGSIWLFSLEKSDIKKFIIVISLLLQITAIMLSLTRAVWLAFAVALVFISYFIPRYQKTMRFLAAAGVVALVGFVLLGSNNSVVAERSTDLGPIYSRLTLYGTALSTAIQRPVFGYGFGTETFYQASRDHLQTLSGVSDSFGTGLTVPHNELLHMLVLTGLVGVFIYVSIFKKVINIGRNLYQHLVKIGSKSSEGVIFLCSVILIYILNSLVVDFFFFTYLNSVFYLYIGILLAINANAAHFKTNGVS